MKNHQQYTCPMHPHITQDKPGTCPICGMNLVLAKEVERNLTTSTHHHGANPPMGHEGHDHHAMMINDFKKTFLDLTNSYYTGPPAIGNGSALVRV